MLICQAIEENVEEKANMWKFEGDPCCENDHIKDRGNFIKTLTMGNG
jgi:hypothetical protein